MSLFTECDAGRFPIISQIENIGPGLARFRGLNLEPGQFHLGIVVDPSEVL